MEYTTEWGNVLHAVATIALVLVMVTGHQVERQPILMTPSGNCTSRGDSKLKWQIACRANAGYRTCGRLRMAYAQYARRN